MYYCTSRLVAKLSEVRLISVSTVITPMSRVPRDLKSSGEIIDGPKLYSRAQRQIKVHVDATHARGRTDLEPPKQISRLRYYVLQHDVLRSRNPSSQCILPMG